MNRFEGRRVLVTGAASGIGQATAVRLHEEGAEVVAADVSPVTITGERITAVQLDVSDEASVNEVVGALDPLDVLVNAAGILRAGHTHEFSLDVWNQVIGINLTGTFLVCR
jgi:NAD(P)-dependent dehydrogenase (short-subunit alcohol dehydrogenase family)